jgi:hypothetical protein
MMWPLSRPSVVICDITTEKNTIASVMFMEPKTSIRSNKLQVSDAWSQLLRFWESWHLPVRVVFGRRCRLRECKTWSENHMFRSNILAESLQESGSNRKSLQWCRVWASVRGVTHVCMSCVGRRCQLREFIVLFVQFWNVFLRSRQGAEYHCNMPSLDTIAVL